MTSEAAIRSEDAISLSLLVLDREKPGQLGYREDVIEKIKQLRSASIRVAGIRIRPGLEGDYSDEVSDFIGRLAMSGYIVQESPIKLTSAGTKLLKSYIRDAADEELRNAAGVLGVKIEDLCDEAFGDTEH